MVGAAAKHDIEYSNVWSINVFFFAFLSKLLGLWGIFATGLTEPQPQGLCGRESLGEHLCPAWLLWNFVGSRQLNSINEQIHASKKTP